MAPENIHAPHEKSLKILEGGVPEAENSKGYGRKNSNIFPGGPRTLSKGNLPRSHLRFDN